MSTRPTDAPAPYDGPPTPGWSIRARKYRFDPLTDPLASDLYDERARQYRMRMLAKRLK